MTSFFWKGFPPVAGTNDYNATANWTGGHGHLPANPFDVAVFRKSELTNISVDLPLPGTEQVGEWLFQPGASAYTFTVGPNSFGLHFYGSGIVVKGGAVTLKVIGTAQLSFFNNSSAGLAHIQVSGDGELEVAGDSTLDKAIVNVLGGDTRFAGDGSGGNSTVHTHAFAKTLFHAFSTGGKATLVTDLHGLVDFSGSSGPANNHELTVGSIAGAGTYELGSNQLTVGLNGQSTVVRGLIEDGGSGTGGSLVKVGHGTLKLSHTGGNSYTGGTTLMRGVLDLAAHGVAGAGDIAFGPNSHATLKIEKSALSGHNFANPIDDFGTHDTIDLAGLAFHTGAKATYVTGTQLVVRSGGVTDTLTLNSPHGIHFHAVSDGHGGTDILIVA
jgi:autotransporter-associated beta strand protein